MNDVGPFEQILCDSGIQLFKYYLDISRDEQTRRLQARHRDSLKQWKSSPIDGVALEHWNDYSRARDVMLEHTDRAHAPWTVVRANDKKHARLNVIRHFMSHVDCPDKDDHAAVADENLVFSYGPGAAQRLEP